MEGFENRGVLRMGDFRMRDLRWKLKGAGGQDRLRQGSDSSI
jgi:hypothetical protein